MNKILITGATGFVGRALIKALPTSDYHLNCIVRATSDALPEHVVQQTLDDLDPNSYFDVIIHLATHISPNIDEIAVTQMLDVNISLGTKLLTKLQNLQGAVFIDFGSFAELYRSRTGGRSYFYAETKKSFEKLARHLCAAKACSYTKIIPFTIYDHRAAQKKILDMILSALNSAEPVKLTEGDQVLDFTHVDDVVSLIKQVLAYADKKALNGHTFECGTGIGTSLRDIVHIITKIHGSEPNIDFGALPYRDGDIMYAVANTQKAREVLSWEAKISLIESLTKMAKEKPVNADY
ncbi:NAD(P)-dependent oxidoreductase [Alphaproteobacteria bacterium]|nr:NAD(P)-dependent oxidoreductase [Alphaproteobacteria bacterium]